MKVHNSDKEKEAVDARASIPKALPFFRMFAVQLSSGSATLRVTVLCVQDTYTSLAQKLRVDKLWELLKGLHVHRHLMDAARDPPGVAFRVGRRLGRLLGTRLGARVFGVAAWAAGEGCTPADVPEGPLEVSSCPGPGHPGGSRFGLHVEQNMTPQLGVKLVVKNSFIELVEDSASPPSGARRCRSCGPSFTAQPLQAHAVGRLEEILGEACRATLMIKRLPLDYTRDLLVQQLDEIGFSGEYNFVYLPVDFTRRRGLGYALVSACTMEAAERMLERLQGVRLGFGGLARNDKDEPCEAAWSEPCRSLTEHIERYRNSPVMHPNMPDEYKPALFAHGRRVAFPGPTRPIRPPRIRHIKKAGVGETPA